MNIMQQTSGNFRSINANHGSNTRTLITIDRAPSAAKLDCRLRWVIKNPIAGGECNFPRSKAPVSRVISQLSDSERSSRKICSIRAWLYLDSGRYERCALSFHLLGKPSWNLVKMIKFERTNFPSRNTLSLSSAINFCTIFHFSSSFLRFVFITQTAAKLWYTLYNKKRQRYCRRGNIFRTLSKQN